jgi:hypothetical protein
MAGQVPMVRRYPSSLTPSLVNPIGANVPRHFLAESMSYAKWQKTGHKTPGLRIAQTRRAHETEKMTLDTTQRRNRPITRRKSTFAVHPARSNSFSRQHTRMNSLCQCGFGLSVS